jgi:hypothetical protein
VSIPPLARVLLLAFTLVCGVASSTPAQDSASAPAAGQAPAPTLGQTPTAALPLPGGDTDDPWGFDEEEHAETLAEVLRPQALDIAVTTALLAFALVSFFKKSVRLKYITLVLVVVYFGAMKSQLMSVTDLFKVVEWNFPTFKYSVSYYLLAVFTLASTVLWGRVYCGRLCAFGAFTQLMDATIPKRFRREPPVWLEKRAGYVKYGILAAVLVYYVVTRHTPVYRYVEPFWMFTLNASAVLWTMLGVLLVATVVVRNLYCRFLCPFGAMLGVISAVTTVFAIKRWSECKSCKICEKACEWGAIDGPRIIKSECVRCDDCERIYHDKKKCVHWLIVVKKEAAAAKARPLADAPAPGGL